VALFNTRFFQNSFRILPVLALLVFIISSCNKGPVREQIVHQDPPINVDSNHRYLYVVNEGNFTWNNASVSIIDLTDTAIQNNIYATVNDNHVLGDVAESMKVMNGKGYIVVNNSNKIEVVSLPTFKSLKSISCPNSPRNIEFIDSTKAYVTNLYKDISVIDLKTLTITKTISTPNWTEGMVFYNNHMFVTCVGTFSQPNSDRKAKILVVDTKEDRIVDSIPSGKEPLGIVIDKRDKVWVLCTGGWDNVEPPSIIRINPDLMVVEKIYTFPDVKDVPSRLNINALGDTLYFLKDGVYQMPIASSSIPDSPFIPASGRLFYGLVIDPLNGNIFVGDAINYTQDGLVYRYNQVSGSLLNSYSVGRIPGSFCFPANSGN